MYHDSLREWAIARRIAFYPDYPFSEARYDNIQDWMKATGQQPPDCIRQEDIDCVYLNAPKA